ncbi:hypothetical protein [Proteiniborus sp. MB09-C3]|uniref:hypothetical protein n=1 Tax=Proteiniborus sp. MB09-C3 TaxID=3050072 RepID=UPI0025571E4D|nr:hypothetical protein [Proteiniborus sp. MB09-C3]WIV10525.1 hypothetical protein QO263_10170 [Proteiniborus sp. MB09-C3]
MRTEKMANQIKEVLEQKGLRVSVSWSTDNMYIDVYQDDYDYSQVILKYLEEEKVEEYVITILSILNDKVNRSKYVKEFKASPVKRFLIDLIKHYDCEEFLFIHVNDLHCDVENGYIPIDDIVDFNYSPFGDVLKLQEDQGGDEYFYTIDFEHRTIETRVELLEDMDFSETN